MADQFEVVQSDDIQSRWDLTCDAPQPRRHALRKPPIFLDVQDGFLITVYRRYQERDLSYRDTVKPLSPSPPPSLSCKSSMHRLVDRSCKGCSHASYIRMRLHIWAIFFHFPRNLNAILGTMVVESASHGVIIHPLPSSPMHFCKKRHRRKP